MTISLNLPIDLQKKNFIEALEKMAGIPGWNILEEENFLAIKSPAKAPLANIVWAEATQENYNKAKMFFAQHSFNWLLTENQDGALLLQKNFKAPELTAEMIIKLDAYVTPTLSSKIEVIQADSSTEFQHWVKVGSETSHISADELKECFLPLIQVAGNIPFLALYEGEPAATSLVYYGKDTASIHAVSTRVKLRRKGLGTAVAHACLQTAKAHHLTYAVLYASKMGQFLYKNMGFQTVQILKEYALDDLFFY